MAKVIGIDLGTTNSCVAFVEEDGTPVVIPDPEGNRTTPSIFAMSSTQEPRVGYPAYRQMETNRLNTIFAVKRLIGRKFDNEQVMEADEKLPYKLVPADNNDAWVEIDGKPTSPEEVSSQILVHMRSIAEEYLGEPVRQAVITVPAHFNDSQRQATKDAGKIAGIDVLRIVNEPTAAALAYGINETTEAGNDSLKTIAVFDLGGGTFDITILTLENGTFDVKSTNGDTFLGGEDFDHAIVSYLLQSFKRSEGIDLSEDRSVLQRLKDAAKEAKHALSEKVQVDVSIPFISQGSATDAPKHLNVVLDRKILEKLARPLIQRLEEPCLQAMEDAELTPNKIDEVILVGGMTRMPAVKKACLKIFEQEPNESIDADEAIATGAAIQAGLLRGLVKGVSLLDVTSLSLGIETAGGQMTAIIPRNTKVPTSASEIFTTSVPNQPQISIHVLQGESHFAPDNKTLGRFELMNIPPAPRSVPKIEVTFDIDDDGILNVSAKDLDTSEEKSVEIMAGSGLSDKEIDELLKENQQFDQKTDKKDELGEARNQLMSFIFDTQFKLDVDGAGFKGKAREELESAIVAARALLGSSSNPTEVISTLKDIQRARAQLDEFLEAA